LFSGKQVKSIPPGCRHRMPDEQIRRQAHGVAQGLSRDAPACKSPFRLLSAARALRQSAAAAHLASDLGPVRGFARSVSGSVEPWPIAAAGSKRWPQCGSLLTQRIMHSGRRV
jgi:hypothetical protein